MELNSLEEGPGAGIDQQQSEIFVASYGPRGADFNTLLHSSELGPQRNIGQETRSKITQKDYGTGGLIALITTLCYGTYGKSKAALIVTQFFLNSPKAANEIRSLEVEITFEPQLKKSSAGKSTAKLPVVRNLSPRKIYGFQAHGQTSWTYKVDQQCYVPTISAVEPSAGSASHDLSKVASGLSIVGRAWSDSRRREMHKACWTVVDKSEPKIGIPDEFNFAMIVEYEDDFQADVKVSFDAPLYKFYKRALSFPWSEDDPVLFPSNRLPGTYIGRALRTTKFETLSDAEWANLISGYQGFQTIQETHQEVASTVQEPVQTATTTKAFRVQGVPADYRPETVIKSLETHFGREQGKLDVVLFSLAPDPERPTEQVATIASTQLAAALEPGDRWQRDIPVSNEGGFLERRRYLILDTLFHGLTPLAFPRGEMHHLHDIIALSGLGGHAFGSFKERGGHHMWLRDDLSVDFPNARVMTYGYDTQLEDSQSFQDLEALANTFRIALRIARPKTPDKKVCERPIVLVAHSLGGIILKQALIQMAQGDEIDKANSQAIRGILFFGVPSQGMDISSSLAMVQGNANEQLLQSIRPDSSILRSQHLEFCQKFPSRNCNIISFYETEYSPTAKKGPNGWKMNGDPALLVGISSATSGSRPWETGPNYSQPIKRNHSDMVKFAPRDPWYSIVRHFISSMVS